MTNENDRRINQKHIQEKIKSIAETYTNNMYDTFQQPGMKGPAFTWKRFPRLAAEQASGMAFIYFSNWDTFSDELRRTVEQQVYDLAVELAQKKITGKEK